MLQQNPGGNLMKTYRLTPIIAVLLALIATLAHAEVEVSTDKGLKFVNGDFSMRFGGRIQYDYVQAQNEVDASDDVREFDLRRGRIFIEGKVAKDWAYKAQFNFDGSGEETVYLRYLGWGEHAVLSVGNQHQPFTLEQLISSKNLSISERSGITERYLTGRRNSAVLHGNMDKLHYAVGVFMEESDDPAQPDDGDFAVAGRLTFAPIKQKDSVLHLGISAKDTNSQQATGFEIATVQQSFMARAEYFTADETVNNFESEIDGYYVLLSYMLTGEVHPYKNGSFGRIKPNNASGAWEVAFRFSDGDGNFSDLTLGTADVKEATIALNYYVNNHVRINSSFSHGEDQPTGVEAHEFRLRFQVVY